MCTEINFKSCEDSSRFIVSGRRKMMRGRKEAKPDKLNCGSSECWLTSFH